MILLFSAPKSSFSNRRGKCGESQFSTSRGITSAVSPRISNNDACKGEQLNFAAISAETADWVKMFSESLVQRTTKGYSAVPASGAPLSCERFSGAASVLATKESRIVFFSCSKAAIFSSFCFSSFLYFERTSKTEKREKNHIMAAPEEKSTTSHTPCGSVHSKIRKRMVTSPIF